MSSKKPPALKEDISPNLVPMIDIMFLLLLFFMLGADMGHRELVDVVLPLASKSKEEDDRDQTPVTNANVHHDRNLTCAVNDANQICREMDHWKISIRGNEYTAETLKPQLQIEADEFPEDHVDTLAKKILSNKKLLIRADKMAPFGLVQKVIEAAGAVGMYKVEVAAARPAPPGA